MSIFKEFRDFAFKGNVIDLAVGVIIGAAFAPIVSSLVDNVIMPPIGYLMAGVDFSSFSFPIPTGEGKEPVLIKYGIFLNAVVKFVITAAAIFLLIKVLNNFKPKPVPAEPTPPPASEIYLKEIRDILAKV